MGNRKRHQPDPRRELRPLVLEDSLAGSGPNARRVDGAGYALHALRYWAAQLPDAQVDIAGEQDGARRPQLATEICHRPDDRSGPEGRGQEFVLLHAVL